MPVFKYLVLNKKSPADYIEVEQPLNAPPLGKHPLTGEPIERILESPTLTLKHSSNQEKKTLSADNLEKNGFSVLQKDKNSKQYIQTVGKNPSLDHLHD